MIRFEVELIEKDSVLVRLIRAGMSDNLLIFEEGEYLTLQDQVKQHGYTCDLINARDLRYTPKVKG